MEISGYKIIKTLGQGGMSTVYLAVQESVNRYVALKVMSAELTSDESHTRRFLREARIAARFRHSNIITVLDVNMANGQPYIAMEYVPGGELTTDRIKSMNLTDKLSVVVQVADAVGFLHSQNFVHRDIKPGNILFREDNTVVLTDFGVAHDGSAMTNTTQTGFIIGTPHYMSPEQANGEDLDARADIYALGVLLFRILAGRVPFTGDHPVAICTMHIRDPIPDLPTEFARFDPVVKKAMAKLPDHRYDTANHFIDGLIAVTGSNTASFLRRSVGGVALEEIEDKDKTSGTQLQRSVSGSLKTRLQPTISPPKPQQRSAHHKPVKNRHRPSKSASRRSSSRQKKPSKRASKGPAVLLGSLIGLGVLVLLVLVGIELWEPAPGRSGQSDSLASQLAEADSLVASGTQGDLEEASLKYASILSRDPQNQQARAGLRKTTRLVAAINSAATTGPANDITPATQQTPLADEGVQIERTRFQETIQNLLAEGRERTQGLLNLSGDGSLSSPYKEVLQMDSLNQEATQGLIDLTENLLSMAEVSLTEGELDTTGKLLNEASHTGMADPGRLSDLENRHRDVSLATVRKNEQISSSLAKGYRYLETDQLTRPEDANAVSEFEKVLSLESNNSEARMGLQLVGQRYLAMAESELAKGNRTASENYLNNAVEILPGLAGSAEIRTSIDNYKPPPVVEKPKPVVHKETPAPVVQQQAPAPNRNVKSGVPPSEFNAYSFGNLQLSGREGSENLFSMAEAELNSGNDLRAYGLYKETLKHASGHAGARKRLNRGAGVYLKYAGRDISNGNLDSAYNNLRIALTLDPDHPKADSTRSSYLAARQQKYATSSQADRQPDDLVNNMRIGLYLQDAFSSHAQFTSEPTDQIAARKAREHYEAVLNLDANHGDAKRGLARLCDDFINASRHANEQSQKDQALWFYQIAREIDPNNPRLTLLEDQLR